MRVSRPSARREWRAPLANRSHDAAVRSHRRAVDRGSERTANEGDDIGNLIGLDESLQDRGWPRNLEDLLLELSRANFILGGEVGNKLGHTFRCSWPGQDRIYCHLRAFARLGESAGDGELRGFGHSVVDHLGRDLQGGFTGDENNSAPVSLFHLCQVGAAQSHSRHHVYREEFLPILIGDLLKRLRLENAKVVDQGYYAG